MLNSLCVPCAKPFTWKAGVLFIVTGAGLWYYFTSEKAKLLERRRVFSSYQVIHRASLTSTLEQELATGSYGKAKIGGPFSLVTHEGHPYTHNDLLNHWSLIYFGFTNCPDICPEELDKMGSVVDSIGHPSKFFLFELMLICVPDAEFGPVVQPIFITCDPARDTVEQTKAYVKGKRVIFSSLYPHLNDPSRLSSSSDRLNRVIRGHQGNMQGVPGVLLYTTKH